MRLQTRVSAVVVALLMAFSGLLVAAPTASAMTYDPPPGVKQNNPLGGSYERNKINLHILRSIWSVPPGRRIRIWSWNIRSPQATRALVAAHRRGVTVQLLMDRYNAVDHPIDPNNPIPADPTRNEDWWYMKREFRKNNNRPGGYRSWARVCYESCRSTSGLPHTKMFLFDRVHDTKDVVMYGSGNFTNAAASVQWNDLYTVTGNTELFRWANQRFNEAYQDRPVAQPWRVGSFAGRIRFGVFPWKGAGTGGDPIIRVLDDVKCYGAGPGVGDGHGRTVIRIAQTGQYGARGVRIARKLKSLWDRGCHVMMIYSLMSGDVERIYRSGGPRGGMPIRQIVQDHDGDFVYDRYLHQKSMTISGYLWNNRQADYTFNGSANWGGYTLASDETFVRLKGAGVRRTYSRFVKHWFIHPPRSARGKLPPSFARLAGIDPYAKIQLN